LIDIYKKEFSMVTPNINKDTAYRIGGFTCTYRLTGPDTQGANALLEMILDPQNLFAPPHIHDNEDEWFYILEGTCRALVEREIYELQAGDTAYVPRGTVHTLVNDSAHPVRFLMGLTPAGMEPFFAELASVMPDSPPLPAAAFEDFGAFMHQAVQAAPEVGQAMATVQQIWGKYGMRAPEVE
jgi:uncharacterized cupin superfamily protein